MSEGLASCLQRGGFNHATIVPTVIFNKTRTSKYLSGQFKSYIKYLVTEKRQFAIINLMHDTICSPFDCLASQASSIPVNQTGQTLLFGCEGKQRCVSHTCLPKRTPLMILPGLYSLLRRFCVSCYSLKCAQSFVFWWCVSWGRPKACCEHTSSSRIQSCSNISVNYLALLFTGTHTVAVFHPGSPLTRTMGSNI